MPVNCERHNACRSPNQLAWATVDAQRLEGVIDSQLLPKKSLLTISRGNYLAIRESDALTIVAALYRRKSRRF